MLLGQRIAGEHATVERLVKDQVSLLPPDPDRFNHLFLTALKGSSLDTVDRLELRNEQEKAADRPTLQLGVEWRHDQQAQTLR